MLHEDLVDVVCQRRLLQQGSLWDMVHKYIEGTGQWQDVLCRRMIESTKPTISSWCKASGSWGLWSSHPTSAWCKALGSWGLWSPSHATSAWC